MAIEDLLITPAAPPLIDFTRGIVGGRARAVGGRRQPLARAVGIRGQPPTVVDATAGLARDAFHLACLGCRVLAIERSPVLAGQVREGLERAAREPNERLHAILDRIRFVEGDSRELLPTLKGEWAPDVVYLDPMYPARTKSALVKKEMRICRELVGDDADAGELLEIARSVARRVVVKRHVHAPPLGADPMIVFRGTRVRYDVYVRV